MVQTQAAGEGRQLHGSTPGAPYSAVHSSSCSISLTARLRMLVELMDRATS
jgi:hypothetical protein